MRTYKVELTEEFIKEAHEVACDEWKTKIKDLVPEAFKNQFQVGKWYKTYDMALKCFQRAPWIYGFDSNKEWIFHMDWSFQLNPNLWEPATDKEVEEALIKEAKKRGLVEGAEVNNSDCHGRSYRNNKLSKGYFEFDRKQNQLYWKNSPKLWYTVFSGGQWAEPIEDNTEKRKRNYILQKIEEMENQLNELKKEL